MTERRGAPRFSVPILVVLQQGVGRTRNISSTGMYFKTSQCFNKVEDILPFGLYFEQSKDDQSWKLNCIGKIIRTESLMTGGIGIAVKFLEECSLGNFNSGGSTSHTLQ